MSKINYKISAKETRYKDRLFRSRLEARWAAFFDLVGWDWEYEPFDLEGWSPDFLIKGTEDILVEVKPITEFHYDTCKKIDKAYPEGRVLLLGCTPDLTGKNQKIPSRWNGFCWIRDKWHIGYAKHFDLFVSNLKPDKDKEVYVWTLATLLHHYCADEWGLMVSYGVMLESKTGISDGFMFFVGKENMEYLKSETGREKDIWAKAGNITRFEYKNKRG